MWIESGKASQNKQYVHQSHASSACKDIIFCSVYWEQLTGKSERIWRFFFARKLLVGHQKTVAQYFMVGLLMQNLIGLTAEQVKNKNPFFFLRQTVEMSNLENVYLSWFPEYCALNIQTTPWIYKKQLKIQWFGWLRVAFSVAV